jgi:hypothetical protein
MRTVFGLRAFAARAKLSGIDHESIIFVNVLTPISELKLRRSTARDRYESARCLSLAERR